MSDVTKTQHWAVTVSRNGKEIVTIESNSPSVREISDEDRRIIDHAARHLLEFIGGGDFTRWRGAFRPFSPPEWEDDP